VAYRLVLFDFDGTLADSFGWFADHLNQAAARFKARPIAPAEIEALRDLDAATVARNFKVPFWKIPGIASYMRSLMAAEPVGVGLFPGVPETLRGLRASGCELAIVSSNSEDNVRRILGPDNVGLISHFQCGVGLFGKASKLRGVLKKARVPSDEAVFVGDEGRDIDAARAAGVKAAAVTWGYNHACLLKAHRPDLLLEKVEDLSAHLAASAPP